MRTSIHIHMEHTVGIVVGSNVGGLEVYSIVGSRVGDKVGYSVDVRD